MLSRLWPAADVVAVAGFLVLCGLGKLTATEATAAVLAVIAGRLMPPKPPGGDGGEPPKLGPGTSTGVRAGGVQTLLSFIPWGIRAIYRAVLPARVVAAPDRPTAPGRTAPAAPAPSYPSSARPRDSRPSSVLPPPASP